MSRDVLGDPSKRQPEQHHRVLVAAREKPSATILLRKAKRSMGAGHVEAHGLLLRVVLGAARSVDPAERSSGLTCLVRKVARTGP